MTTTTTTTIKRAEDLPAAFQSAFRRTTTTSGGFRCARSSCFSSSFPLAFFVFRFSKENKKTDRDKKNMRVPNNNKQTQVFQRDAKRDDGVHFDACERIVRVQRTHGVWEDGFA